MKALAAGLLFVTTISGIAQDLDRAGVYFANTKATVIYYSTDVSIPSPLRGQPVGIPDGPPVSQWHVALEWFDTSTSSWELLPPVASLIIPGRFAAGTRYHYWPWAFLTFRVQAWSGNQATYYEALAANDENQYGGISDAFLVQPGHGDLPPQAITSGNPGFSGMTVQRIAEPSASILGLLGAITLLPLTARRSLATKSLEDSR